MTSHSDSLHVAQPDRPYTGRLLTLAVYANHTTLVARLAGRSLQYVDVDAVPDAELARMYLAGLRRVIGVHIEFSRGGTSCHLRAATRHPVGRAIPLAVALALAVDGIPTSVTVCSFHALSVTPDSLTDAGPSTLGG